MRSELKRHLAFAIQPPTLLRMAIERQCELARAEVGSAPPPMSPPHLTLLYMPCDLLDRRRLRRAVEVLRMAPPLTLRYAGLKVSPYGTIQLGVHPQTPLSALHASLVATLGLDNFKHAPASSRLIVFGTTNFGEAFSPHVTLGRFSDSSHAAAAAACFATLPEMEQQLSTIWIADATGRLDHRLAITLRGIRT